MLQFAGQCRVYAENISPHSKFRFRELVSRLEGAIPGLRAASSAADVAALLADLDATFRDVMALIQR